MRGVTAVLALVLLVGMGASSPIDSLFADAAGAAGPPAGLSIMLPADGVWAGRDTFILGHVNHTEWFPSVNVTVGSAWQVTPMGASNRWETVFDMTHMSNGPATIAATSTSINNTTLIASRDVVLDLTLPRFNGTTPSAGVIYVEGQQSGTTGSGRGLVIGRLLLRADVFDADSGVHHVEFCIKPHGVIPHCREDHKPPYTMDYWLDGLGGPLYMGDVDVEFTVFDNALNERTRVVEVTRLWTG